MLVTQIPTFLIRSMDIVQSAGDSNQIVNTGWIGRYLESIHPEYPAAYPNQNYPQCG